MKFVPKNLISYWFGVVMHIRLFQPLAKWSILLFAKFFKINCDEAEKKLEEYNSIGDFFTRRLREGSRPISNNKFVHVADSEITSRGLVFGDQLIQAKGLTYSLKEFIKNQIIDSYQGGFFITYYLCPTDYHRVHSPVDGMITEVRYVPGNLWPVNRASVGGVPNLFCKNERVIVDIQTDKGIITLVFVGATNVGSILLNFEPSLKTNHNHKREFKKISYLEPIPIKKGDELGMFSMGSTVILVGTKDWLSDLNPIIINEEPSLFVKVRGNKYL